MSAIQLAGAPPLFDSIRHVDVQGLINLTYEKHSHLFGQHVRDFLISEGFSPVQLPKSRKSYREMIKEEAAHIAEEERQEALEAGSCTGGQLSEGGK